MKDKKYLDDVNNKRVEETRTRVAHAIKLCDNPVGCLTEGHVVDNAVTDIAHAVNLLEAAEQDMRFACEHFGWDTGICDQLNAACMELGRALAYLVLKDDEDYDPLFAAGSAENGLAKLSQALATLIRWFDDDTDVSEV